MYHFTEKVRFATTPAALNSYGDALDKGGVVLGDWDSLCGGGRNSLALNSPSSTDIVLYQEEIRASYKLLSIVSHTFSYSCRSGEEISAVLAYDLWTDNTGGTPEHESGGVGQSKVKITVNSERNRGFHFKFIVYGTRRL